MTVISKQTAPHVEQGPGFEGRFAEVGDLTVSIETYDIDTDLGPLFAGLPNDHCQCAHFGVVLAGQLTFHYEDGTADVVGPGDGYVAQPGHRPKMAAGTRVVEFTKSDELAATMEVVSRNLAALGSA